MGRPRVEFHLGVLYPTSMKIASWNVNSIRARRDRFAAFLDRSAPDVLCLQELKCVEGEFPLVDVATREYEAALFGQRTYNGVAILAREPLTNVRRGFGGFGPADALREEGDARLIAADLGGASGLTVVCAYFPNGGEPSSDKYAYKLQWMARLAGWLAATWNPERPLVLCGDYNVAPTDLDVAKPAQWKNTVLCRTDVRAALEQIAAFGLTDLFRVAEPTAKIYSWWDYRSGAWETGEGLRIDHIYGTQPLVSRVTRAWVESSERDGDKPSDHAPVFVELDL
jgi:exodeoxyribonuclease III